MRSASVVELLVKVTTCKKGRTSVCEGGVLNEGRLAPIGIFFARSAFLLGYTRGALGNGYSAGAKDLPFLLQFKSLRQS